MNAIAPIDRLPQAFRDDVTAMEPQFQAALPPQIPVERFMRVVMTAVNSDPALLQADRHSLFESAVKAAQDGLLPDKRDGAFVIFKGKVQWMPMVGGILKKVRNSGELKSIAAHVVYENDQFSYELGDEERIEHKPNLFGDRGAAIAVYAVAKTKDGGIYREIMSRGDVEKVRSVSRSKDTGPWVQWWDEMARKTVIRRLAKRLPMSSDLDDIIRRDDEMYDLSQPAQRERSGFAARIASMPQGRLSDAREGFDGDLIDATLNAPAGAPASDPSDVGPPRESEGSVTSAPDADEVADGEPPRFDDATRTKLVGYAKDMLRTATSGAVDRGETMTKIKDRWKVQLEGAPAEALTVAAEIWTVTRNVAKTPDQADGAITHLAYEIDVDPAALRVEAA